MDTIYQQAKLIVFDLDGTLYEDTAHFDYYAQQLKLELKKEVWADYEAEYKNMIDGQHIVSIGKAYDVVRDYVLRVDSLSLEVIQAWTWDGRELSAEERTNYYNSPISFDFDSMIAIGDGWWLPNVCARHFGVVDTQTAYHHTKEYMATDQFTLTKIPHLKSSLLHLKTKKNTVLLTNSQDDDVARLLHLLDLEGTFDHIITVARKPQHTLNHFSDLMEKYKVSPEQCLSVGDNFINEIAPAVKIGMKTILIDCYSLSYPEYQGIKVSSISDTLEAMRQV
jgi:HAD superfamily hydrolase (TIGR01509 family)